MSDSDELIRVLPMPEDGIVFDRDRLGAAVAALAACQQACTACSGVMADEGMGRCANRCATCASMCGTVLAALLRPASLEIGVVMALLEACIATCLSCNEECRAHAERSETCHVCSERSEACAQACEALVTSLLNVEGDPAGL